MFAGGVHRIRYEQDGLHKVLGFHDGGIVSMSFIDRGATRTTFVLKVQVVGLEVIHVTYGVDSSDDLT